MDDLLRALRNVSDLVADEVPAGWYTSEQIGSKKGVSREQATRQIGKLILAGKAERKRFRVKQIDGVVRPTYHYRMIHP